MSLFTRANGYGDIAQEVLKHCQADKISKKTYLDFMCQSYGASLGMQKHIDIGELEMGATVHYQHYTPNYDLPQVNHWNNGEKQQLTVDLDNKSVNACNVFGYQLKLSRRDYVFLQKCKSYKEYTDLIAMTLVAKRRAILDSYVPAVIVGSAGQQVGTPTDPVTATAESYEKMIQEIVVQAASTEMVCSYEEAMKQIVIYLPHSMLRAHLQFWAKEGTPSCQCNDGIRKSLAGYSTPYGFHVEFVNDRFLPRDETGQNVLGFWVNRGHVGVVNKSFYEDWFPMGSDLLFEGEMLYDAFLLNCKAAGVIITDQKPTCPIIC